MLAKVTKDMAACPYLLLKVNLYYPLADSGHSSAVSLSLLPAEKKIKYQHFHSIFEGIKKILGVKVLFERYSIKLLESIIIIQNDIEMLMADNHRVFKSIQRASWSE